MGSMPSGRLAFLRRDGEGPFGARPRASVVLLHGHGRHVRDLFDRADPFDPQLAIFAAQAPHRIGPGAYRWFAYEPRSNDVPLIDPAEEATSFALLTLFLAEMRAATANAPVYLAGHSQGAMMALSIALLTPHLIDGCAAINGRILDAARDRPLQEDPGFLPPVLICHGVGDTTVPIRHAHASRTFLKACGYRSQSLHYACDHEVTTQMLNDVSRWVRGCAGPGRPSSG